MNRVLADLTFGKGKRGRSENDGPETRNGKGHATNCSLERDVKLKTEKDLERYEIRRRSGGKALPERSKDGGGRSKPGGVQRTCERGSADRSTRAQGTRQKIGGDAVRVHLECEKK